MLAKSPSFTAVAVLTLALGIGANTTIFSVVSSLILRKPPVHDPDGLLVITSKNPANVFAADRSPVSASDYLDWQEQASGFRDIAAADFDNFTISGATTPEFVSGARVSANFLKVMQVQPILGRLIFPGDDQAGHDRVVLISAQLWHGKFAGDPRVLGRALKINGNSYAIIGVMPESFSFLRSAAQIWFPLVFSPDELGPGKRSFRFLSVFARLKPGVRMSVAAAEMDAIADRLAKAYPDTNKNWGAHVMTEQQYMVSDWNATRALGLLMVVVGLVLLAACANVASMLLARNTNRAQEFSIRATLGAGRLRLVRQLLTECLLLSLLGAALGVFFAYWAVRAVVNQFNWNPVVLALAKTIGIDLRVLILTAAIACLVALIVGIAPALRLSRSHSSERLKQSARGITTTRERHRLQRLLVIGQIALSLILLTAAGLFVEDFIAEMRSATGLNSRNVLTGSVSLRGLLYYGAPQRQSSFFQNALRQIAQSPEVESVAATSTLPFDFPGDVQFVVEGHPVSNSPDQHSCDHYVVSSGYFHTLQIPLLQGREFTPSEGISSAGVVIVDTAFAQRYFPNQNPVGHHLLINSRTRPGAQWSEIIGVVGEVNEYLGQDAPRPHIFEPFLAHPSNDMSFVVRTRTEAASFSDSLRRTIWAVDSDQAVSDVKTMDRVIADSGWGENIMAGLMGGFAAMALLMAAMGIYGVLSYLVAQRTHEIGIRMALGAERHDVLSLIMRNAAAFISVGVAIGATVSVLLPRVVRAIINGVWVSEWWILVVGTTLTVTLVALAACYFPARRAMRVDPMVALRYE